MIFEKSISTEKWKLHFFFNGIPKKEGIDSDKLKKLLDKVFDNNYFGNDLKRIVTYLRTMLADYEENYLLVETNVENMQRDVKYYDGKLIYYIHTQNTEKCENNTDKIDFIYDNNGNGTFSFSNKMYDLKGLIGKEKLKKIFLAELDYLFYLTNNIKPVELKREDKIIITIYNLFYGELPDFSDKDIEAKFQNMLYILSEFGISTQINGDDTCFLNYGKYPESQILQNRLIEIIPIARNVEILDVSKLNKEIVDLIKLVGKEIRDNFKSDCDKNNLFERFCYAIYNKKYCYPSNIALKEMAKKMKNKYFGTFSEKELIGFFELRKKWIETIPDCMISN